MSVKNLNKLKVGSRYMVRFLDHSMSNEKVILMCRVYGWLVKNEKDFISISSWEVENEEFKSDNVEIFNIIKSTIKEIKSI